MYNFLKGEIVQFGIQREKLLRKAVSTKFKYIMSMKLFNSNEYKMENNIQHVKKVKFYYN
jgi:D-Tyr-tRNAtyr deacylase